MYVWEKVKIILYQGRDCDLPCVHRDVAPSERGPSGFVTEISESFGASIGKVLVPFFAPLGLGYWQIVVALIAGIAAKEVVVSSCSVLFGVQNITTAHGMDSFVALLGTMGFGAANAYALMVFCLLYVPCTATNRHHPQRGGEHKGHGGHHPVPACRGVGGEFPRLPRGGADPVGGQSNLVYGSEE